MTGIRERLGLAGGRSDAAIRHYNRALTRLPRSHGLVVFESMVGAQYSDSPRAIYDELRWQGLAAGAVWSVARDAVGFPEDVPTVRRWTPDRYRALARAHAWVTNQGFPAGMRKSAETTFVQTWHGTPLKRMGRDDPASRAVSRRDFVDVLPRYIPSLSTPRTPIGSMLVNRPALLPFEVLATHSPN